MRKALKNQLFEAVGIDQNATSVKLQQAEFIKPKEKGKFLVPTYGAVVFADTMYLPHDPVGGWQYILTVVDVATRRMDAMPMKGRTALDIIEAFESIFKRKYITSDIETIYTDPGSEFKNKEFKEYLNDMGINLRHTMTARKNQSAVVEQYNHFISKTLMTKLTSVELETKLAFNEWKQFLNNIVVVLNKPENQRKTKITEFFKDPRTTVQELNERLKVGDIVHVRLQSPKDHLMSTNNKLHGNFRNGDVRFELTVTEITNVLLLPNQPIRYMTKKYNNVSFMRKELLLADEKTKNEYTQANPPPKPVAPYKLPEKGPITRGMTMKANTKI